MADIAEIKTLYLDEKLIKQIDRSTVYIANEKLFMIYIKLVGNKQISLAFDSHEKQEAACKVLNEHNRNEVKRNLILYSGKKAGE